eukprot:1145265-Pelagomonas_calceolata.AAC.4
MQATGRKQTWHSRMANAMPEQSKQPGHNLNICACAIPKAVYSAICGAVVVAELGLVDAAYSGDWSRIGIITSGEGPGPARIICACDAVRNTHGPIGPFIAHFYAEQELQLQQAVLIIAAIHGVEAAIAAYIAKGKGVDDAGKLLAVAIRVSGCCIEIERLAGIVPALILL